MTAILLLKEPRQEDHKSESILTYIARLCKKKKKGEEEEEKKEDEERRRKEGQD